MADQKRGDDAADHAPKTGATPADRPAPPKSGQQDAPNYDNKVDGGRAEPVETLNSANDE